MYTQLDTTFEYDFTLFGIKSESKEYKLAWALNRSCFCHFKKAPDITLNMSANSVSSFSHFRYQRGGQIWRLLNNQPYPDGDRDECLLPEVNQWNFLLWLHDPGAHVSLEQLQRSLKTIPDITGFSQISVDLLPNKDNLLF